MTVPMLTARHFGGPDAGRRAAERLVFRTFALPIDDPGGAVSVVGDFNDWNPYTHPMRRRANQTRSAAVTVRAGSTLHFRYLAEGGVWFDDETVDAQHGPNAVITV